MSQSTGPHSRVVTVVVLPTKLQRPVLDTFVPAAIVTAWTPSTREGQLHCCLGKPNTYASPQDQALEDLYVLFYFLLTSVCFFREF